MYRVGHVASGYKNKLCVVHCNIRGRTTPAIQFNTLFVYHHHLDDDHLTNTMSPADWPFRQTQIQSLTLLTQLPHMPLIYVSGEPSTGKTEIVRCAVRLHTNISITLCTGMCCSRHPTEWST